MNVDYNTVIYICKVSIPFGIIAGFLGHLMGKVFQQSDPSQRPKKNKKSNKSDLYIDDLLINDISKSADSILENNESSNS